MNNATTLDNAPAKPDVSPWIIAAAVSIAAFMEVLDTSIANVALPHIAGNLGATFDQSTWVLTSYLAANAIVLPITGWLTQVFGRKRFFMLCIASFTATSFCCGIAPTLGILLAFRVLQGAFGGGLQPMAQAILADSFPAKQRGLAFALYGITAVCGPVLGPTLGGWITDNFSWRWIFYINLPVGILALVLVYNLVKDPSSATKREGGASRFDYLGFGLLAVGIGALQVVLDKGQEDDWFSSHLILWLSIIAVICLASLVVWEWFRKDPIVDVHLFKNLNFATSNLMLFSVGFVIYAGNVLVPQLLQTQMGYTAELAGFVLSGGAILVLVALPFIGKLTSKYPAKYLISIGWFLMAIAMYVSTRRTDLDMSFSSFTVLRIYQTIPLGFLFVPVTTVAYVGLAAKDNNAAAGLVNFTRNIGGSVGTSVVATVLARRSQYHQSVLAAHTGTWRFQAAANQLALRLNYAGFGSYDAHNSAIAMLARRLYSQAAVLSYIDLYWILSIGTAVMFLLSFFLKKNNPGEGGAAPVH